MCTYVAHRTLCDSAALYDPTTLYELDTLYDHATHPQRYYTTQRNHSIPLYKCNLEMSRETGNQYGF